MARGSATPSRATRARILLVDAHTYAGLLCAPGLVVLALSALLFHHPGLTRGAGDRRTEAWQRAVPPLRAGEDKDVAARGLRDALALSGNTVPWETRREPDGALVTRIVRPGLKYDVRASPDGLARVEEARAPALAILRGMHALQEVPNGGLARSWGPYVKTCTVVLVLQLVSGATLWLIHPGGRRRRLAIAAAAALAAAALVAALVRS